MNVFRESPVPLPLIFTSHHTRLAMLRLGTTEIRQKGVLFNEGERARELFVILRGDVSVSAYGTTFRSDASPGDCIGLLSVLIGSYSTHAENAGTIVLRVVPRRALLHLISEDEDVCACVQSYIDSFGRGVAQMITLPRHAQHTTAGH